MIFNGSCFDYLELMEDESVNLVFTDPPYGIGNEQKQIKHMNGMTRTVSEEWDVIKDFDQFTLNWLKESYRVLKPNGSMAIYASHHNLYLTGHIIQNILGMKILNNLCWYKRNSAPSVTCRMFTHSVEYIIWAVKGKNWTFNYKDAKEINGGKQQREVFDGTEFIESVMTPRKERVGHPTQKPMDLTEYLIRILSNSGDLVFDPFMGSGTTGVAAEMLEREFVGCEKNDTFFSIAKERMG